jgi:hypothetical protein
VTYSTVADTDFVCYAFSRLAACEQYIKEGKARLGQPDGISPSRMAEMLEVDKAGPKVRC